MCSATLMWDVSKGETGGGANRQRRSNSIASGDEHVPGCEAETMAGIMLA